MNISRTLAFTVFLLAIAACSRPAKEIPAAAAPVTPPAATGFASPAATNIDVEPLMKALFGKDYRAQEKDALAVLPDPDNDNKLARFIITPVAANVLDNGETVLIANAETADEAGGSTAAHASSGLLNVYFLRQENGHWVTLRRHENIASLGSSGNIGQVSWVKLSASKPGFAVLHGGTWQGYSITTLSLFELGASGVHDLTGDSIAVHSDNEGGCGPQTDKCWNINGKWQFVPGKPGAPFDDLVIEFTGEEAIALRDGEEKELDGEEEEVARQTTQVRASALYAFDGKEYRLVKGSNIVPGI